MGGQAALLQLASAALPVGGFTYSRGLETAVSRGLVFDVRSSRDFVGGLLASNASRLDGPLVVRVYEALRHGRLDEAARWAEVALATRETEELLAESRAMGRALFRLLRDLGLVGEDELAGEPRDAYLAMFALAAQRLGLSEEDAVLAYLFSWLDGTITACVKLVPLGQTDGQRLLLAFGRELDAHVATARTIPDEDVGALSPGLALLSSWHETEHTRLFRS